MKEKISFALKLKERVLFKNLSLKSFELLPEGIYKNLSHYLKNFLLLYKANIYKPELQILTDSSALLKKSEKLPPFKIGELLLLILPFPDKKFIFQCKVIEYKEEGFLLKILDPRAEERIKFKGEIPIFLYFIPPAYIQQLLQNEELQLLRESNFSEETFKDLPEIHIYDLVLNERHSIDDSFKKLLKNSLLIGSLVDISRSGICLSHTGQIKIEDPFKVFYINVTLSKSDKQIKLGLFCHLRDLSYREGKTFFHFTFLISLREEIWKVLKSLIQA